MSSVYTILAWYGLLMIVTILVQVSAAFLQVGNAALLSAREDMPKLTGMAGRLDRAQMNNVVAMAMFAPAIFLLGENAGQSDVLLAAQIFLAARIVYVLVYATSVNGIRTASWLVGFGATAYLYLQSI